MLVSACLSCLLRTKSHPHLSFSLSHHPYTRLIHSPHSQHLHSHHPSRLLYSTLHLNKSIPQVIPTIYFSIDNSTDRCHGLSARLTLFHWFY